MSIWKIDIYGKKDGQDVVCCTVVVRDDSAKDAELLAEKDHAMHYPLLSKSPHAKSCGLASDKEAQQLDEGKMIGLIMYKLHNEL